MSVSSRGNSSEPEVSLYQILDISDQKTGLYTLTLSVRDNETGEESVRIQDLFCIDGSCPVTSEWGSRLECHHIEGDILSDGMVVESVS